MIDSLKKSNEVVNFVMGTLPFVDYAIQIANKT